MNNIKFTRIAEGEYQAKHEGFEVEISKNYEERNWSITVWNSEGKMINSDLCYSYKGAKEFATIIIEESK